MYVCPLNRDIYIYIYIYRAYTNPNQSSIAFDYFFFFCGGEFDCGRLPNLIEPYRSIKFDLI